MRLRKIGLHITVLAVLGACLTSCDIPNPPPNNRSIKSSPPPQWVIRIGLAADQSLSVGDNRVEILTPEHLNQLFELLRQTGGEMAVTAIRERSTRTLVRLRLERPPIPPVKPEEEGVNPFELSDRKIQFRKETEQYNQQRAAWEQEAAARISRFTDEVKPLLDRAPNAKASDVISALERLDLYISEPTTWDVEVKNYIVLVTDGEDNVSRREPQLKGQSQLIIVNGNGKLGVLKRLNPQPFESIGSAFLWVAQQATKNNSEQVTR